MSTFLIIFGMVYSHAYGYITSNRFLPPLIMTANSLGSTIMGVIVASLSLCLLCFLLEMSWWAQSERIYLINLNSHLYSQCSFRNINTAFYFYKYFKIMIICHPVRSIIAKITHRPKYWRTYEVISPSLSPGHFTIPITIPPSVTFIPASQKHS